MRWLFGWRVVAAWLAAAVFVGPSLAQQDPGTPSDMYVQEDSGEETVFQSLREFGSFGVSFGLAKVMGGDVGSDAQMKGALLGTFRYRFSERWIGVADFGFAWNDFEAKGDTVLTFTYGSLGAARSIAEPFGIQTRLGVGAGVYRWNYKFHGESVRDPGTFRFYRGISPGVYVGIEGERRLTRHVTVTGTIRDNFVFTADEEKFSTRFDENHSFLTIRVGANYHFSPYEGILWEKKGTTTIRLESGKAGK